MTIEEFAGLVKQMRKHQMSYFRRRSQEALSLAKAFEAKVDEDIEEILNPSLFPAEAGRDDLPGQQQLFGE